MRIDLDPLACVAHERKVEVIAIAGVFQPSELMLEEGRECVRARHSILGAEVEVMAIPLGIDVHDVIEVGILRWRLDMSRFKDGFNELIRPLGNIDLDAS